MIPAQQLRIGNYVKGSFGQYIQVESINEDGINIAIKEEPIYASDGEYSAIISPEYHFENIHPIPLTPEILEKCWFEKHYTDDNDLYYFLKLTDNEYQSLGLISGVNSELELFPQNTVKIKHLHQLQNLYFAITGKELKVEL